MLAAALSSGCVQPQRTYQPSVDPAKLDDVAFLHYLAGVPVVTADEGMRAVLLATGVQAQSLTFDERSAALSRLGAVKSAWRLQPGQILDKGTLAFMLRTICRLPRGFNEVLASTTGLGDRRYALKACIYEGLMPYGLAHEPVTGGELLSSLTAAEKRLTSRPANRP